MDDSIEAVARKSMRRSCGGLAPSVAAFGLGNRIRRARVHPVAARAVVPQAQSAAKCRKVVTQASAGRQVFQAPCVAAAQDDFVRLQRVAEIVDNPFYLGAPLLLAQALAR